MIQMRWICYSNRYEWLRVNEQNQVEILRFIIVLRPHTIAAIYNGPHVFVKFQFWTITRAFVCVLCVQYWMKPKCWSFIFLMCKFNAPFRSLSFSLFFLSLSCSISLNLFTLHFFFSRVFISPVCMIQHTWWNFNGQIMERTKERTERNEMKRKLTDEKKNQQCLNGLRSQWRNNIIIFLNKYESESEYEYNLVRFHCYASLYSMLLFARNILSLCVLRVSNTNV